MSMLVEYVLDSSNKRVGVVVALNSEDIGGPNIGWSRCNWRDKFNKKKALEIAIGRAKLRLLARDNTYEQNKEIYDLPPSMVEAVEKMRERMKKYFQEKIPVKRRKSFDDTLADIDASLIPQPTSQPTPSPFPYDSREWSPK